MGMLLAEDLVLLLLDDASGRLTDATHLDAGIGGALLAELALAGNVEVVKGSGLWARAKVRQTDAPLPADPLLAEALEVVAQKERTAEDLVGRLGRHRREVLLERLCRSGILREREVRVLGVLPRRRWVTLDGSHQAGVRARLADALLRGAAPSERTAALVALLSALDLAHKVIDREGLPARELKRRAKELSEGDWAAKAVRDAVAAAQAAVAAAVVASTSVTTTSG